VRRLFGVAIFLGAFLLFQVQPMIARYILPWFGGASAVWITCMLFFQAALVAGYLYAHGLAKGLSGSWRTRLHIVLLAASLAYLPVIPAANWKPVGNENPGLRILLLLTSTLGLPYLLLASTSPLLQFEYARRFREQFPYRFFALSNLASMLGLFLYPTVVEPLLTRRHQAMLWSALYVAYALAVIGALAMRGSEGGEAAAPEPAPLPSPATQALWVLLPACASLVMLAGTQYLIENLAPMPLLWVLLLGVYLLSFILCFDRRAWYRRGVFVRLHLAAILALAWFIDNQWLRFKVAVSISIVTVAVFLVSMYCHGEVVRRRPDPSHLTRFYLLIAVGGALGGLWVGLVSPLVVTLPLDLPLALLATAVLTAALEFRETRWMRWIPIATVAAVAFIGLRYAQELWIDNLAVTRNFYGTLRVTREIVGQPAVKARLLMHGVVEHGMQIVEQPLRMTPTTYFGIRSGVHLAIARRRHPGARVGVIGLGVGTIAAYAQEGDVYRFYEINPQVLRLATRWFSFLTDTPVKPEVVLGDGRLSLEREDPQGYDVFAIDAFSGDAIPAHLLTREALEQYLRHVRPDGIIAFHISNKVLDLEPVVAAAAAEAGLAARTVVAGEDPRLYRLASTWVLLSRDPAQVDGLGRRARIDSSAIAAWTDEYSSIWRVMLK
jgi:hypothetical protein